MSQEEQLAPLDPLAFEGYDFGDQDFSVSDIAPDEYGMRRQTPGVTLREAELRRRAINNFDEAPSSHDSNDEDEDDVPTNADLREDVLEAFAQEVEKPIFVKIRNGKRRHEYHHRECRESGAFVSRRNHGRKPRKHEPIRRFKLMTAANELHLLS